ncbi:hypothetical protein ACGGZK_08205 [Agromyces sp. MMS24-K17]|uniref:hypothetical protein n=1 Tax=Agromyces sp. MMS24-K17 TaxID=3372850 RepID=UPI003754E541
MSEALWWLPSLVVFGAAAAAVVVAAVGARRLSARRGRRALDDAHRDEVAAKGLIVRADEAMREAERGAGFVEARFGDAAAAAYRAEVARAGGPMREALLLQQRLDDAEPDTAAERRARSARIGDLCGSVLSILERADAAVAALRDAEAGALEHGPRLAESIAELDGRRRDASAVLDGLAQRVAPEETASARAAAERAAQALLTARALLGGADASPADVVRAATLLERARADVAEAEAAEAVVDRAEADVRAAADALRADLAEARTEAAALGGPGDGADPALAAALVELGRAIAAGSAALVEEAPGPARPTARLARVTALADRLGTARAEARRAGGRLDGARSALGGAISVAEHALEAAADAIAHGRPGADARTRFAEAERQLRLARQEPDPVAALDAARRAAARAADAEALARYGGPPGGFDRLDHRG